MTTTEQTTTTELHDQIIEIVAECCLVKPENLLEDTKTEIL